MKQIEENINFCNPYEGVDISLLVKKLDERAILPKYAHDGDMGMDLTAISVEYDASLDMYIYHTGLAFETEKHLGALIFPRSSNRRTDAYLCNHVGVIDTAIYRGELTACFKNRDSIRQIALESRLFEFTNSLVGIPTQTNNFTIKIRSTQEAFDNSVKAWNDVMDNPMDFAPYKVGEKICQMIVFPYPNVIVKEVDNLSETDRGENGYGSTGK